MITTTGSQPHAAGGRTSPYLAPHRRAPLGVGAAVVAATAGIAAWNPNHGHVPLCPFKATTGLDCPLCGGLRAVFDATHGHVAAAASQNLLAVVAAPVLVVAWLIWLRAPLRFHNPLRHNAVALSIAAITVGFWIVRNLPLPALHWLHSGLS